MGELLSSWSDTIKEEKGIFSTSLKFVFVSPFPGEALFLTRSFIAIRILSSIPLITLRRIKKSLIVGWRMRAGCSQLMLSFCKCCSAACRRQGIAGLGSCSSSSNLFYALLELTDPLGWSFFMYDRSISDLSAALMLLLAKHDSPFFCLVSRHSRALTSTLSARAGCAKAYTLQHILGSLCALSRSQELLLGITYHHTFIH